LTDWSSEWRQTLLTVSMVKVKWYRYRPGVAQRVGRGMALLFHDRGTRRGWVVRSTPRPHFTSGKDTVPILQVAGWAPGPVWTGGKSRPHRPSIPDPPVRSQSLYRLKYPAQYYCKYVPKFGIQLALILVRLWINPWRRMASKSFGFCIRFCVAFKERSNCLKKMVRRSVCYSSEVCVP